MNEKDPKREWTEEELKFRRHWAIVLSWFVVMVGIGICFGAPAKSWFLEDHAQLGLFPQQVDPDPCVQIAKFFESLLHPDQGQSTGSAPVNSINCDASNASPPTTQPTKASTEKQSAEQADDQAVLELNQAVNAALIKQNACRVIQTYNGPSSCFGDDSISVFILNLYALAWRFCAEFWDIEVMPSWNSYFSDQINCRLIFFILSVIYAAVLGWCVQTALKLLHAPFVE